jgi:hypothetical protein
MLADPQSVTPPTLGAQSLPAVSRGVNTSTYRKTDGTFELKIEHSYGKRNRHVARVNFSKIAADPLISAQNIKYSMSAYLVIDEPITGFSRAECADIANGLIAYLAASTYAKVTNIVGGES